MSSLMVRHLGFGVFDIVHFFATSIHRCQCSQHLLVDRCSNRHRSSCNASLPRSDDQPRTPCDLHNEQLAAYRSWGCGTCVLKLIARTLRGVDFLPALKPIRPHSSTLIAAIRTSPVHSAAFVNIFAATVMAGNPPCLIAHGAAPWVVTAARINSAATDGTSALP